MKSLLLWDIDGTLINADGAGCRAVLQAMKDCFGVEASFDGFELAGRTDRQIMEWLMVSHNLENSKEIFQQFSARYIECLNREILLANIHTYKGVESILQTLHHRDDIFQGLLTGNLSGAARVKLECLDLCRYFSFGAYGEDGADRNTLGPIALQRASRQHGYDFETEPDRVYVIGDTDRDIVCGKAIGAVTIAVATGFHSKERLATANPTLLLDDFTEPAEFFAILNDPLPYPA